jgi:hypothetical protein
VAESGADPRILDQSLDRCGLGFGVEVEARGPDQVVVIDLVVGSFNYQPAETPQGQFVVAITLDDPDQQKFPIGMQGRAAIYTNPGSAFVAMRKVAIRSYTWYNWLYPFSG